MKVSAQEQKAFSQLRSTPVHRALEEEMAKLKDTLVRTDDPATVQRIQGAARKLEEILSLIDEGTRHNATPGKRH